MALHEHNSHPGVNSDRIAAKTGNTSTAPAPHAAKTAAPSIPNGVAAQVINRARNTAVAKQGRGK